MLLIDGSATISAAESYLAEIAAKPPLRTRELRLAHNLRLGQCGGLVSLIQVIATWARRHESPVLLPYLAPGDPSAVLSELVASPPGIAAVLMAKTIGRDDDLKPRAYAAAKIRIQIMDNRELRAILKGPRVSLLAADQTSLRALSPLYSQTLDGVGALRSEADFEVLADELLDTVIPERRRDLTLRPAELGVFIRELFANTHDHARTDAARIPYSKSVRGIYLSHHLVRSENIGSIASGYAPLEHFMVATQRRTAGVTTQFLEISIYDSGPGWAGRVLGPSPAEGHPVAQEYAAVLRCFEDGFSTTGLFGRGMGLPRMLTRLKEHKGFIRLRTGRMSLYRSFATARGPLATEDRQLVDSLTGDHPVAPHAQADGSVITLLIPLRMKQS